MSRVKKCNFGDLLDDLIVDRIIFGIRDDQLRTKLLDIDPLSRVKMSTLCRSAESCKEQSQVVASDTQQKCATTSTIAAVKTPLTPLHLDQPTPIFTCRNCGTSHSYRQWPAFGKTCSSCNRKNHFAAHCHSRPSQPTLTQTNGSSTVTNRKNGDRHQKKVAELSVDSPDDITTNELYVNSVQCEFPPGCYQILCMWTWFQFYQWVVILLMMKIGIKFC